MKALSQPLFASLRGYDRAQLGPDLFSGALIALLSIPISMGYAQLAGLPPDALRQEVQRAAKAVAAKARSKQLRQDLNPVSTLQPGDRAMRYTDLRSAMAEEGVLRLRVQDDTLFSDQPPLRQEEFSSPLLGRIYSELWQRRGSGGLTALSAVLTPEEMSHLTTILQKPVSVSNGPQELASYVRVIRDEYAKRSGFGGQDPLAAAQERNKDKKQYGGKRT